MNFSSPIFIVFHVSAFAFFVSVAFSGFMIHAGLLDQPEHRSNHAQAVPTAGGLGIAAGFGAGMLALALFYPSYGNQGLLGSLTALGLGAALLGLFDDVYDVNSKLKFLASTVLACASVYIIGPPQMFPLVVGGFPIPYWLGLIGAVLWIFVVTNGVNFMDGANGMMAGTMTISFVALCMVSVLVGASGAALISFVMAAALIGFLLYNFGNQAKIFSGDVGSLLVGFLFASASLLLVSETPVFGLLYVGPLLILPFLVDILLTMFLRASRRENLFAPHSTHLYQRLIRRGQSHVTVSLLYGLAAFFMGVVTVAGLWFGMVRSVSFLAVWVCVLSMIYLAIYNKLSSHKRTNSRGKPQSPPDE